MSIFEVLRERVDLVEVARQFTELKPSGNKFLGRCPFPDHQDNTPSFYVYPDKRFYCFGCQRYGDVTDLWASIQGLGLGVEAALDLAREHNAEVAERDPEAQKRAQKRREQEDRYLQQAGACHKALDRHTHVAEYLEGRGFGKELQAQFLLGVDRVGMAVVIPYWHRGSVKGLIRRKLTGEPKYIYPRAEDFPEGHKPLFIPGPVRAGAFLVEGIFDALAVVALGESGVAVGATSISEHQMRELERLPGPLYVLPDADEEGAKAAREWARKLYPKVLVCPPEYGGEVAKDA
jgi:DNA primase